MQGYINTDKFRVDEQSYYKMVAIITAACEVCGVEKLLLAERGKAKRVTTAREIIVYIAKATLPYSYPDLAEWLGRPRTSHSTMMEIRRRMTDIPGYMDCAAWMGASVTKRELLNRTEQMLKLTQEAKA